MYGMVFGKSFRRIFPVSYTHLLIDKLIDLAFAEDIGDGDHTTLSCIPATAMGKSKLLIKEVGVLAGIDVYKRQIIRGRLPHLLFLAFRVLIKKAIGSFLVVLLLSVVVEKLRLITV